MLFHASSVLSSPDFALRDLIFGDGSAMYCVDLVDAVLITVLFHNGLSLVYVGKVFQIVLHPGPSLTSFEGNGVMFVISIGFS